MSDSSSYLAATRAAYDAVADVYAERFKDAMDGLPLDRALLAAFAELVPGAGPVADLGCGPGNLTGRLRSLGLTAFGVDVSQAMVAIARQAHPDLRFDQGDMTALDLADGVLGGVLAWYSIIHTPPALLPAVFAEFQRVLAPGGCLLLAFFAADPAASGPREFDHKVSPAYRLPIDLVADLLRDAGLVEVARMRREPEDGGRFLRGHLLARKPTPA